jgi:hypothetical protein
LAKLKSCFSKELTNYIETGTTKRDIFKKKLNKEIRRKKMTVAEVSEMLNKARELVRDYLNDTVNANEPMLTPLIGIMSYFTLERCSCCKNFEFGEEVEEKICPSCREDE